MRTLLQCVSWIVLLGAIVPSILFLLAEHRSRPMQWSMLITTIAWFVVTPLWMGREDPP